MEKGKLDQQALLAVIVNQNQNTNKKVLCIKNVLPFQNTKNTSFFLGSRLRLLWKLPTLCGNFLHIEAIYLPVSLV
jgi:hypothetical protein